MSTTAQLPTVGAIAAQYGVPIHRVLYIVAKLRLIPDHRAGRLRVFSDEQVQLIADALAAQSSRRVCPESTKSEFLAR